MANRVDLTGQRFGKLVVQGVSTKKNKSGTFFQKCLCDCGNISYAITGSLRSGNSTSCGCSRKINYNFNSDKDLKESYGLLKVIKNQDFFSKIGADKSIYCICKCGKKVNIKVTQLKNGNRKSCGYCTRLDFTNLKLNYARVVKCIGYNHNAQSIWQCKCVCGNYFKRSYNSLRRAKPESFSCGCKNKGKNYCIWMSKEKLFKNCEFCENKFTTFNLRQKFCHANCRAKHIYWKNKNLQMKGSNLRPKD